MKSNEKSPTEDQENDRLTSELKRLIEDSIRDLRAMIDKLRKRLH
jgi:hypothetical protein